MNNYNNYNNNNNNNYYNNNINKIKINNKINFNLLAFYEGLKILQKLPFRKKATFGFKKFLKILSKMMKLKFKTILELF